MPKCLSCDLEGVKDGPRPISHIRLDSEESDPTFSESVENRSESQDLGPNFQIFFDAVEKYPNLASLGGSMKTPKRPRRHPQRGL